MGPLKQSKPHLTDGQIEDLFSQIAHGDEEHRVWLKEAITSWAKMGEIPPPRGGGTKEARIIELEAKITELRDRARNAIEWLSHEIGLEKG
jgi:hypothetical protein